MKTIQQHRYFQYELRLLQHQRVHSILLTALALLLAFEATRSLPVKEAVVPTPVAPAQARLLARPVVVVPVLRAGLGMLQGILTLLPEALVGHIGLARNEAVDIVKKQA